MAGELAHVKVAVLVMDGFELIELTQPVNALREAGATAHVVSPEGDWVRGWDERDWGTAVPVDAELDLVDPAEYHALILPGGLFNPDQLRMNPRAVAFVRHFTDSRKPVAAICHGPWTLIEADGVRGRRLTSYPSLRTDLSNAGAEWVNEEVVVDGNLVTSRAPEDLPAFIRVLKETLKDAAEAHPPELEAR
jgi:protease I